MINIPYTLEFTMFTRIFRVRGGGRFRATSRRIFIDMLHLYGTRGEHQDLGENNFRVCEEVQHNRIFVAEGRREGKKRKYICTLGA